MTTRPLLALSAAIVLIACSGCGVLGACGGDCCPYGVQSLHPFGGRCCTWLDFLGAGPHLRQCLEPAPCVASPCGDGPPPWWGHVELAGYQMIEAALYEQEGPIESAPLEPAPLEPTPEFSAPPQF